VTKPTHRLDGNVVC